MNENRPFISIIIPFYNVADYIESCLISIINQTYKNFEIILIDDGSTDESVNISESVLRDSGVVYTVLHHTINKGQAAARNAGLKIAKGRYLFFIDSDDYVHTKILQTLLQHSAETDADIVACNFNWVKSNGEICLYKPVEKYTELTGIDALKGMFEVYQPDESVCGRLIKGSLFADNNIVFEEGRFFEDTIANLHLLYSSKKVILLPDALYFYRQREGSTTKAITKKYIEDRVYLIEYISSFLLEKNLTVRAFFDDMLARCKTYIYTINQKNIVLLKEQYILHKRLSKALNKYRKASKNFKVDAERAIIAFSPLITTNFFVYRSLNKLLKLVIKKI